jgi:hypothetical protein
MRHLARLLRQAARQTQGVGTIQLRHIELALLGIADQNPEELKLLRSSAPQRRRKSVAGNTVIRLRRPEVG